MHYHAWSIIYIDAWDSESEYLFYSRSPFGTRAITSWSRAATPFEEVSIKHWALSNAPGIPLLLASCFAWKVTPVP
jgi:hypothetical protein